MIDGVYIHIQTHAYIHVKQLNVYMYIHIHVSLTTYSKTKVRLVGVCIMSCRVTMLACLSPFSREAAVSREEGRREREREMGERIRRNMYVYI